MNIFNKVYCRIYQFVFKLVMPFLPYRKPKVLDNSEGIISADDSSIAVYVVPTNEELMIIKDTYEIVSNL